MMSITILLIAACCLMLLAYSAPLLSAFLATLIGALALLAGTRRIWPIVGLSLVLTLGTFYVLRPQPLWNKLLGSFQPAYYIPHDFRTIYTAHARLGDDSLLHLEELYEIEPLSTYEIVAFDTSQVEKTLEQERVQLPKPRGAAREGIRLRVIRSVLLEQSSVGLLRERLLVAPWDLRVRVHDIRQDRPKDEQEIPILPSSEGGGSVTIEMPRYSFLAGHPAGELIELPQKDVWTVKFGYGIFKRPIELYRLQAFRVAVVRDLLRTTSALDLTVTFLSYAFGPLLIALLAIVHGSLAGHIRGWFVRSNVKSKKRGQVQGGRPSP